MHGPKRIRIAFVCVALIALTGCSQKLQQQAASMTGGNPKRGKTAIVQYGCSSCHTIPGIREAKALVGPPLNQIASRTYIAGVMKNTPENMIHWIQDPPHIDHLTAMPNLHIPEQEVRDIASYLYTLR
jgi:cytochrome c